MKHASLASIFAITALFASPGCNDGSNTDGGLNEGDRPFREEWRQVVAKPFPLADMGDTVKAVKTLTIGRRVGSAPNPNFANRGDVEVLFDLDTQDIVIEMRRYAFQATQEEADAVYAKMSLWAYKNGSSPKKPADMAETDNCQTGEVWPDGCSVYVYYDGQSQPVRIGADLRVHLPKAYRQSITVNTEDNLSETAYQIRGDVTIKDLCGSATVALSSGNTKVRFCRELTPGPTCSQAQIDQCNNFMIDMMPAPWDSSCPCTTFGKLGIEAKDPYASNITIDIPYASVWSSMTLRNDKGGQVNDPASPEKFCEAKVEGCDAGKCEVEQSNDTPWKAMVALNYPGPSAPAGAGYAITAVSNGCETVLYSDGPEDFDPDADEPKKSEERGNITICDGCLAGI